MLALARIAGARQHPQEGLALARRAVELAPDDAQAWLVLAHLALDTRDLPTAAQALDRLAALLGADHPQVALTRALLLRAQGQPAAVDQLLRATLARYPGFQPAAALLLANAAEHGRRAEAEAFLASLRAGGP